MKALFFSPLCQNSASLQKVPPPPLILYPNRPSPETASGDQEMLKVYFYMKEFFLFCLITVDVPICFKAHLRWCWADKSCWRDQRLCGAWFWWGVLPGSQRRSGVGIMCILIVYIKQPTLLIKFIIFHSILTIKTIQIRQASKNTVHRICKQV